MQGGRIRRNIYGCIAWGEMRKVTGRLIEVNPEAMLADGLDKAIIGVGSRNGNKVAVYSSEKCIEVFMENDGMSYEDAMEYFTFNTEGAYVGKYTPIFKWND
tara:strand:+ start:1109 stop:1414 length:306 start_codon:yes stop_codon:yes gene_type:complete